MRHEIPPEIRRLFKDGECLRATYPIDGLHYNCYKGKIDIQKINFWEENPRVLLEVREREDLERINQDVIYDLMADYDDTIRLQGRITREGGIKKEIMVAKDPNSNDWTVYDGNTRLTVARKLFLQNSTIDTRFIDALVLSDERITMSTLEYEVGCIHLDPSMNDWDKHKKARFFYDRIVNFFKDNGIDPPKQIDINKASKFVADKFSAGIKKAEVSRSFEIISFMDKFHISNAHQKRQYYYWDPYFQSSAVKELRKDFNKKEKLEGILENPQDDAFDKMMINKVKYGKTTGEVTNISAGGDGAWRKEINDLAKAYVNKKKSPDSKSDLEDIIFKMFNSTKSNPYTLQHAVADARDSGAANVEYTKIRRFQEFFDNPTTLKKLRKLVKKHKDLAQLIINIETSAKLAHADLSKVVRDSIKKRKKKKII